MLLTLPAPAKTEYEFKSLHDFLPQPPFISRVTSPKSETSTLTLSLPAASTSNMTTPHRGLPPPAPSMTLPDPGRLPPPIPPVHQSHSNLPAFPSQWQATDESMRNWLVTKAEEERRKQEEEKTRQESLRLEQRKIEQSMLQESIRSGVPPNLVPMIFIGIGGASIPGLGLEWLQQYTAQLAHQQQTHVSSPDARRSERLLSQSQQPPYPHSPMPPAAQGQPGQYAPPYPPPPPVAGSPTVGSRSLMGPAATGPTSAPRGQFPNPLPRLSTSEMHIPPLPPPPPGSGQPPAHVQTATPITQTVQQQQQEQQSSPSIYFHHWVPPSTQSGSERASGGGGGSGGAAVAGGSSSVNPASSTTPAEYTSSPKKRKATGSHQAAPPPSAPHHHHRYSSPSLASTPGRRGHTRQRSDVSSTARGRGGSTGSHDAQSLQQNPQQSHQQGWQLPNVAESTGQGPDDPNPSSSQHHQHQHQQHQHQAQRSRTEEQGEGSGYGSPRMSTRRSGGHSHHPSSERSSAVTSTAEGGQVASSRGESEY